MAGRVLVRIEERKLTGERSVVPQSCPAQPVAKPTTCRCMAALPGMPIRICPFLYASEALVEGTVCRHIDVSALLLDIDAYPDDRNAIRILCLRQESKETSPGV